MVHLFQVFGTVVNILLSVNLFVHIWLLGWFQKKKRAGASVALIAAGLSIFVGKNLFSTAGMALLTLNMVLIAFDIFVWILKIFGKGNPYAFFKKWKKRGLAFLCAALYCAYGLINVHIVRETTYSFENASVPGSFTVAVVSDAHLGTVIHADNLASKIEKAISSGAEIVVLAGDIVDESTDRNEFLDFARMMQSVRAPKGIYFVFGNHDASHYGGNITRSDMETELSKAGITVLTDEGIVLDGWLRIIGREDANRDRKEPSELLKGANPESELILMIDHQPAETRQCAEMGVDLLVSGHTHNGQIFPVNWLSVLLNINEIEYGHKQIDDMHAVVSSGIAGWASAFRTAGKSEYVIITLKSPEWTK